MTSVLFIADEAANVIRFGCSIKKGLDSRLIGQYGNGLKSGSMRIGKDMILFTKKGITMSCLMISRTFHETEKIKEVIVPLPSFHVRNLAPLLDGTAKAKERHEMEMELILKYSPFRTRDQLFAQFKRIKSDSGTLVVVYNLKLLDSGECELDFKTSPQDILLNGQDESDNGLVPQRRSFRSYVSILYLDPRMKICIQGHKVQLVKFVHDLYKPRQYQYTSARFKTRAKDDVKRAETDAKSAAMRAKEAEGKARDMEKKYGDNTCNKDGRAKLRLAQKEAERLKEEAKFKASVAEKKKKLTKAPKTLSFIFGVNLENRNMDGLFIYNCCRLIKMNIHPGFESGNMHRGVVGLVDIPYIVLEPTHNKQDFADAKEYRHLLRALGEHHAQYWRDLEIGSSLQIDKFWECYGYTSSNWTDLPSQDLKYVKKRAMQRNICIQCDSCLKWRILPFSSLHVGMKYFPENWKCSLNSDVSHNRCSAVEEKFSIPDGKLKKIEKTKAEKHKQLVQEIAKLKGKLHQVKESDDDVSDAREEQQVVSARKQPQKSSAPAPKKRKQIVELDSDDSDDLRDDTWTARKRPTKKAPPKEPKRVSKSPPPRKSKNVYKGLVRPARIEDRKRSSSSTKSSVVHDDEDSDEGSVATFDEDKAVEVTSNGAEKAPVPKRVLQSELPSPKLPQEAIEESPKAANVRNKPIQRKLGDDVDVENEEAKGEEEPPPKRVRKTSVDASVEIVPARKRDEVVVEESEWPDAEEPVNDQPCVGSKVEVRIRQKWYFGYVVNLTNDIAQVKFDKYPDDKYDKKISLDSPNLKLAAFVQPPPPNSPSLASSSQEQPSNELPSSSTSTVGNQKAEHEQMLDDIARGFRTSLHYFLPPQWIMDKETINSLSTQELSTFPLDDFFDNYEKGLRKLVSGFQMDSVLRKREAERAEASLKNTTRLIVRLLNIIHEEYNLDPEKDRDKLDNVLLACVKQAEESAKAANVSNDKATRKGV